MQARECASIPEPGNGDHTCDQSAPRHAQDGDDWESISAAIGWSTEDCLNFKLAFKKRDDAKTVKEAMGQHFKRLRALGWYLLRLASRCD